MNIIIHKILQHKRRYIFLILSLVIIQSLVFLSINFITDQKSRFFPETPFDIEDCFELEVYYQKGENRQSTYSTVRFDNNYLNRIRNIKEVKCATIQSPFQRKNVHESMLYSSGRTNNILCMETGRDFEKIFDRKLLKGKIFSDTKLDFNEVIVTKTLADSLGIINKNLPFTITIHGNSKKNSEEKKCRVVGILEDVDYFCEGKKVYPIFSNIHLSETILIKAEKNINIDELEEKISSSIQPIIKSRPVLQLVALNVIMYELWNENKRQYLTLLSIIPLVLFYSFLALFSLFWIEVTRNKTKYGILRAIGFNRLQVFLILLKEAAFLSILSSILTTIILINFRSQIPSSFSFSSLLIISILAILVFVVFASIVPAIKTTLIHPAQTLSNE